MNNWIDDTGWVHYHPKSDSRQKSDGFGDSPHHTGFYITAKILNGALTKADRLNFIRGFELRIHKNGFMRHPRTLLPDGSPQFCNRDQLMTILYPIRVILGHKKARMVYDKTSMLLWPHQWLHMKRQLGEPVGRFTKWFCELFERPDADSDGWSKNNSSIIKNHYRYEVAKAVDQTSQNKRNAERFGRMFNVADRFKEYFTYKHDKDRDNPPPLHLLWFKYE